MRSDIDSGYGMFDKYDHKKIRNLVIFSVLLIVVVYILLPFHKTKMQIEDFVPNLILSFIKP